MTHHTTIVALGLIVLLCLVRSSSADTVMPLTADEITTIVAEHNRIRSEVSPAAAPPLPNLVWDPALANIWANNPDKCIWAHYANRGVGISDSVGENIALYYPTAPGIQTFMAGWADEKIYWGPNYKYNTGCTPNKVCGHYTQQIWANTKRIGCIKISCDNVATPNNTVVFGKGVILACDYSPAGNYNGQEPYSRGTATCTPTTCASKGFNCGTTSDGCGSTLNCGTCNSGSNQICYSNLCRSCSCPAGRVCGTYVSSNYGGACPTLNCGTCSSGATCNSNGQCIAASSSASFSRSISSVPSNTRSLSPSRSLSKSSVPSQSETSVPSITRSVSRTPSTTKSAPPSLSGTDSPSTSFSKSIDATVSNSPSTSVSSSLSKSYSSTSAPSVSGSKSATPSRSRSPSNTRTPSPSLSRSNSPAGSTTSTASLSMSNLPPTKAPSKTPQPSKSAIAINECNQGNTRKVNGVCQCIANYEFDGSSCQPIAPYPDTFTQITPAGTSDWIRTGGVDGFPVIEMTSASGSDRILRWDKSPLYSSDARTGIASDIYTSGSAKVALLLRQNQGSGRVNDYITMRLDINSATQTADVVFVFNYYGYLNNFGVVGSVAWPNNAWNNVNLLTTVVGDKVRFDIKVNGVSGTGNTYWMVQRAYFTGVGNAALYTDTHNTQFRNMIVFSSTLVGITSTKCLTTAEWNALVLSATGTTATIRTITDDNGLCGAIGTKRQAETVGTSAIIEFTSTFDATSQALASRFSDLATNGDLGVEFSNVETLDYVPEVDPTAQYESVTPTEPAGGGGGGDGLEAGAIVGIAIGSAVGFLILVALIAAVIVGAVIIIKKRSGTKSSYRYDVEEPTPEVEMEVAPSDPRKPKKPKKGVDIYDHDASKHKSITGRIPSMMYKSNNKVGKKDEYF